MIESWKQSGLAAVVVIATILVGAGLQAWSLRHSPADSGPLAQSPFSVVDMSTLQRAGIQLDQPTSGDRPAVTWDAILAATPFLRSVPQGEARLLRLTLIGHLDGTIHQRLVWGIEILARPDFPGGPALAPGEVRPTPSAARPTFWMRFYDAHDGSFIFGFASEK